MFNLLAACFHKNSRWRTDFPADSAYFGEFLSAFLHHPPAREKSLPQSACSRLFVMQLSGVTYMFQGSDSMDWAGGSHRPRGALGSSDEMRWSDGGKDIRQMTAE